MIKSEQNLRDLWDTKGWANIYVVCSPRKRKGKGAYKIFEEIMVENFSLLVDYE